MNQTHIKIDHYVTKLGQNLKSTTTSLNWNLYKLQIQKSHLIGKSSLYQKYIKIIQVSSMKVLSILKVQNISSSEKVLFLLEKSLLIKILNSSSRKVLSSLMKSSPQSKIPKVIFVSPFSYQNLLFGDESPTLL